MVKKILIITPFHPLGIGGAETFAMGLITEAKKRFSITTITLDEKIKGWDEPTIWQSLKIGLILLWRACYYQIWCEKNDTVHCLGVIATTVGMIFKKIFKVKLLSTHLAIYDFLHYPTPKLDILRWIYKHVDKLFVEDEIERDDALKGLKVPAGKIIGFMHWVDLKTFKPNRDVHIGLNVLFIGRPIYKKGKHIIQEIERDFRWRSEKIKFTYVEDAPHKNLPNYYQNADIFVIPSVYMEGVARVVLEAAACGCAIISSDYGSLRKLVKPFGIVIQPTVANFKEKILWLYHSKHLLKRYKNKAMRYAQNHFSNRNTEVFLSEY